MIRRIRHVRASTWVGLAAVLLWSAIIPYGVFRYFGGDPRALLWLGSEFEHPPVLRGVQVEPGLGYDGQFFAALAADPFLRDPKSSRYFDVPAYRAGRIGLPVAAWVLAAGDGSRAVFAYQFLVWLLSPLLVWLVARWLEDDGRPAWWAAPLALTAGLVSTMHSSLPDAVSLLLALAALRRGGERKPGASPLLAAAVLVKESSFVAAFAGAAREARVGRWRRAVWMVLLPVGLVGAWRAYVTTRPGFHGLGGTNEGIGIPFAWVPEKLAGPIDPNEWLALAALVLTFAALGAIVREVRALEPLAIAYAGWAILALHLTRMVYVPVWWNYARVLLPMPILALLLAERAGSPPKRWLLRSVSIAWALVGATAIYLWVVPYTVVVGAGWIIVRASESRRAIE